MARTVLLIILAIAALDAVLVVVALKVLAWRGVTVRRTRFGLTLVFDTEDASGSAVRMLNVGGTFQSACYTREALLFEPVCAYHRNFARVLDTAWGDAVADLAEAGEKRQAVLEAALSGPAAHVAVVVGGGGHSFPAYLVSHRPDTSCVAVEIDPKIQGIARESFFIDQLMDDYRTDETGRLELVCADGWEYLRQMRDGADGTDGADGQGRRPDLIVNDAFAGKRPLGPLGTDEGARLVRDCLTDGGIYLANVRCPLEGAGRRPLDEVAAAFARLFSHVYLIPEHPEQPDVLGNNTVVACDRELTLAPSADESLAEMVELIRGT